MERRITSKQAPDSWFPNGSLMYTRLYTCELPSSRPARLINVYAPLAVIFKNYLFLNYYKNYWNYFMHKTRILVLFRNLSSSVQILQELPTNKARYCYYKNIIDTWIYNGLKSCVFNILLLVRFKAWEKPAMKIL